MNHTPWVVAKFGGTSVATRENWLQIQSIIRMHIDNGKRLLLVCSACSQMSNALVAVIEKAKAGDFESDFLAIKQRHQQLADDLSVDFEGNVGAHFDELHALLRGIALLKEVSPRTQATVLSFGEILLTTLGAAFLKQAGLSCAWLDAREALSVDAGRHQDEKAHYLSAQCCADRDDALCAQLDAFTEAVVITQGFIARNEQGDTVLLGRGGSDVSAAYFSVKIGATACEIWTDVPGIYTANPNLIPESRLLKQLDYDEAQEIAAMGAKVLHPNSVPPVKAAQIPLTVKYIKDIHHAGTKISTDRETHGLPIKSVLTKYHIVLINIETVSMWQQSGFLADVFLAFKKHHLSVDLISTSESSLTVSLDVDKNLTREGLSGIIEGLSQFSTAKVIGPCASVSLIGRNIRTILHKLGPVLEVFECQQIHMLSQSANDLNLTFIVDEDQAERIAKKLHTKLVEDNPESYYYSQSWRETVGTHEARIIPWWEKRKEALVAFAAEHAPCYVYDQPTLKNSAQALKKCGSVDAIFYAMKANPNPEVLNTFYTQGLGFECVSIQEVQRVLSLFPDIARDRILFTPNFAPRAEYEAAFELGVHVTIDGLHPLAQWPEIFRDREILVRIDPGMGFGHHKYVCTGGAESKFGIPEEEIASLLILVKKHCVRVKGFHAHHGSGILQADVWQHTAKLLTSLLKDFPDVGIIDLGGGLGIVEKPGQKPLDLQAFNDSIQFIKNDFPALQVWMEPGRYLVASAGVLLSKVTQRKSKGETNFIGIDTGMNSLIRPGLYGSYHGIFNLTRFDEPLNTVAHIVGPICESGDTLGYSRFMPETQEGDVILIANTGAYGHSMSSHYNLRPPAKEHFLTQAVSDVKVAG